MAKKEESDPCPADLTEPKQLELPTFSKDGTTVFRFRLPGDGLALRSVRIINGVPELRFEASPKVPTITEEDVATIFRLVSEGKRPEFFYRLFPLAHPMHRCRYFMKYSPAWLRWTAVGELLAEADWTMKCLHIGTRTNKEKSVFKSWSAESHLEGLASRLDFPEDGPPFIFMSCEYVKIEKSDDEITFSEEPKMKITDGSNPVYSKYITEIYSSVAYYDEPKFLAMQELIKLIVGVEWLFKEKGMRANQDWIMQHTSEQRKCPETRKKPPPDMIPKPTIYKRPPSDVTVKTREALLYEALETKLGVKRQYGYLDFSSAQLITFKEDGTPCPPRKYLKVCTQLALKMDAQASYPTTEHQLKLLKEEWCIILLPGSLEPTKNEILELLPEPLEPTKKEILKLLPKNAPQDITFPVPAPVDTKVEYRTDERGMQLKVTSVRSCPSTTMTKVITASMGNPHKHYTDEDPNMPIEDPRELIIPDVKSWDELISELSVPIPRILQDPFVGIGHPMTSGGVTTSGFRVEQEAKRTRVYQPVREETQQVNEVHQEIRAEKVCQETPYNGSGPFLDVAAECIRDQGMYVFFRVRTMYRLHKWWPRQKVTK